MGGGERWDRRPEHLVEEVAVLGGRQLDSFLHREPHVRRQRPLAGRAVEPAGSPQASAGEAGLSASAQVGCPAPTRTCGALQPLRASPLHVGVLQRLGCAKPLVGGEHQESPEEVQGLRRCVRGQEARQRLTRPAGARGPFLSRWGPLPTPMSVAQVQPCTWPHFNCLPNPCVTLRRPERVVRPLCAPSCAWPPTPPAASGVPPPAELGPPHRGLLLGVTIGRAGQTGPQGYSNGSGTLLPRTCTHLVPRWCRIEAL